VRGIVPTRHPLREDLPLEQDLGAAVGQHGVAA